MKNNATLVSYFSQPEISILPNDQNNEIFESLYKRYWAPLVDFASYYINDKETCEELVQELFIQLYVRGLTLKVKHTLTSYLCVALKNRIYNHFRNKAVYKKHIAIAAKKRKPEQNNIEQSLYLKELENSVHHSLQNIPSRYKEVYLLKQNDLTVKQISQILSRPLDTVEKQLRKAKKLLVVQLKGQDNA